MNLTEYEKELIIDSLEFKINVISERCTDKFSVRSFDITKEEHEDLIRKISNELSYL
jgi:cell fate (sporulation/competence/biofilm development) regulator YmcA (YheA/YmcA/DUF963 family)